MIDPVRIIVDGNLSVPLKAKVFQEPGKAIVLTTTSADETKRDALIKNGIDVIIADGDIKGKVDLSAAMTGLALKGIDGILLEGGATLAADAFEAGIVDKVRIYAAPILIGGKDAPGLLGGKGADTIPEAVRLKNITTLMSGSDLIIEGYVDHKEESPKEEPEKSEEAHDEPASDLPIEKGEDEKGE